MTNANATEPTPENATAPGKASANTSASENASASEKVKAKAKARATGKMNIHLADEDVVAALKTILAYEASVRNRTIGQVCSELVLEAVDTSTYPEQVQARLTEIAEESERRAVAKSLEMSDFD